VHSITAGSNHSNFDLLQVVVGLVEVDCCLATSAACHVLVQTKVVLIAVHDMLRVPVSPLKRRYWHYLALLAVPCVCQQCYLLHRSMPLPLQLCTAVLFAMPGVSVQAGLQHYTI
jgi:hypothetical protein